MKSFEEYLAETQFHKDADEHLAIAKKHKEGTFEHHHAMAVHHDAMAEFHSRFGRRKEENHHDAESSRHSDIAMKLKK